MKDRCAVDFLVESYEKEKKLREKWNVQHQEEIKKAATFTRKPKNYSTVDVNKSVMVVGMLSTAREHTLAAKNKYTKQVKDYLYVKDRSTQPGEATMKPVEKEVKDIISNEGTVKYLKARNEKAPEDKFNFIETTNWRYGWEFNKYEQRLRGAEHGMHLLTNAIKSRTGPQQDPDHYKSADFYKHYCYV